MHARAIDTALCTSAVERKICSVTHIPGVATERKKPTADWSHRFTRLTQSCCETALSSASQSFLCESGERPTCPPRVFWRWARRTLLTPHLVVPRSGTRGVGPNPSPLHAHGFGFTIRRVFLTPQAPYLSYLSYLSRRLQEVTNIAEAGEALLLRGEHIISILLTRASPQARTHSPRAHL